MKYLDLDGKNDYVSDRLSDFYFQTTCGTEAGTGLGLFTEDQDPRQWPINADPQKIQMEEKQRRYAVLSYLQSGEILTTKDLIYLLSLLGHYLQVSALIQGRYADQQNIWTIVNVVAIVFWLVCAGVEIKRRKGRPVR